MKKILFAIIISLIFLTGCSVTDVDKTEKYEGGALRIGIIGDIPEIRESQVKFEQIDFNLLKEEDFDSRYDAIFITRDNLHEASNAEYVSIYKISKYLFILLIMKNPMLILLGKIYLMKMNQILKRECI